MSRVLSRELVIQQFEADMVWRRLKWCPLMPLSAVSFARGEFAGLGKVARHNPEEMIVVSHGYNFDTAMSSCEDVVESINLKFKMTDQLLKAFEGEMILAGGCLARSILSPNQNGRIHSPCDADFFFIGCTKERILEILDKVEVMFRITYSKQGSLRRITSFRTTSFVANNQYQGMDSNSIKYQFVHSRSYPSAEAVLLGFDIPASSVLYNGEAILMTPMAAFTFATGVIFIDPSRRSTTYEKRLSKYTNSMRFSLGTLATTLGRIKQAYTGRRELVREIDHELIPGIKILVEITGEAHLRGGNWTLERGNVFGDYGAEAVNEYMIKLHNGFFALLGQPENIAWIKKSAEQKEPKIETIYPQAVLPWPRQKKGYGEERVELKDIVGVFITMEHAREIMGHAIKPGIKTREQISPILTFLKNRAMNTLAIAEKRLKENDFDYIGPNDNPGRQHTSSFNPVYGNVRDYWFYGFYDVTNIGLPNNIYLSLKTVLRQHNIREKGVLRIILQYVMINRAMNSLSDFSKVGEFASFDYDLTSEESGRSSPTEYGRPGPIDLSQDEQEARKEEERLA